MPKIAKPKLPSKSLDDLERKIGEYKDKEFAKMNQDELAEFEELMTDYQKFLMGKGELK